MGNGQAHAAKFLHKLGIDNSSKIDYCIENVNDTRYVNRIGNL